MFPGVAEQADRVVEVSGTTLRLWSRDDDGWRLVQSSRCAVGRKGVAAVETRLEGDGTTPAGVFPLAKSADPAGHQFSCFGTGDDPGVRVGWHDVTEADWWCCTPGSGFYDRPVDHRIGPGDEHLSGFGDSYEMAAVIGVNAPGRASAIFLHVAAADGDGLAPTAGCVALGRDDLAAVLTELTPNTWFVINPVP